MSDPTSPEPADRLIDAAIARGDIPGAVLLVGRSDGVLYRKAYGNRALEPRSVPMTVDTVFDLASLSKPIGCATSVMKLIEQGKVKPEERIDKYVPAAADGPLAGVTVSQLLLHWSGLIPDNNLSDYADGPATAMKNVYALKPQRPPGTRW